MTALSHAGIAPKDICSVTGHRGKASLKHYCEEPTDEQKADMSIKLHFYMKKVSIVKQTQKPMRSHQFCLIKTMQWISHQNLDHHMPLMGPVMLQCCHTREFPILSLCQTLSPSIQLQVLCLMELYSMGLLHLICTEMCCIRTRISCICVYWLLWVSISFFPETLEAGKGENGAVLEADVWKSVIKYDWWIEICMWLPLMTSSSSSSDFIDTLR